ncbi:M28 family peptidase [Paenibacillus alvei]|uniref:Peptidase M28 n=1 Tax=Paenibacillus alvei TaxID=44250 RepID=A0A383RD94_PAEAL|nr:M28 family peptidase [Paenibacillus alvei]SYX84279.1 Peptidase M28 [Paenibacillus alvei]
MGKTVRVHQTYMTRWSALGIAVICIMLVLATLWSEQPPAPKGENAPIEQFSAERAMKHVRAIAQLPHPSGSLENERVRTYLVEQMELLGLQPNVNTYPWRGQFNGISESFELHNIIGVHKGTKPGKALMLTAHYDSTPFGPGANDDAVGVAALLETARILQASPSMDRDIWFVLTDGEEKGLLGAEAFWFDNKVREQIGLVVNFEARGSRGPSIMFQSSRDNGKLISEFASFAVSPVSTSLLGDLYLTMPNETDLTVSLNAGIPGLNFGYIDGWDKYHSEQDTPDNVSMATLQHHGENALAAAKQFGSMDLEQLNGSDRVYFNWFTMLLHYPASWSIPMSILIGIGWLFCIAVFFKKRTITLKGMALSFLLTLGSIIASVVIAYLVFVGIMYIGSSEAGMPLQPASIPAQVNLAFVLIALLVHLVFTRLTRHRVNVLEMILTGMLFYFLLLIVVLGRIPGASYLFLLPLLIHCIVIGCTLHKRNPIIVLQRPWVSLVFALAPLTLTTSLFHVLYTGMPLQITLFTTILCVLILTLLQPLMTSLTMVRASRSAKIVDRK